MDYSRRRAILDAIEAAIKETERNGHDCIVCGDDRPFTPETIRIAETEPYFFKATVEGTADKKGDDWIELIDRNAELDSIKDIKAAAICNNCAIAKGLKKAPVDPEAIPVAPGTTPEITPRPVNSPDF